MGNDLHRQAIAPCVGVVVNGTNGKSAMKRMRSLSPRPGSVVFVGSQVFQNWAALGKDMPGLPVVNVAYTGAMVSHLVKHAGDVLALKPRVLVWYCGNMDLEWGHKPVATFDAFRAALRALRKEEPTLPIVYVGTIVGPRHKDLGRGLVEKCHELNRLVADFARSDPQLYFVDVNDKPFGSDSFNYEVDRCRLTAGGNRLLAAELYPVVARAFAVSTTNVPAAAGAEDEIAIERLPEDVARHLKRDDVAFKVEDAEAEPEAEEKTAEVLTPNTVKRMSQRGSLHLTQRGSAAAQRIAAIVAESVAKEDAAAARTPEVAGDAPSPEASPALSPQLPEPPPAVEGLEYEPAPGLTISPGHDGAEVDSEDPRGLSRIPSAASSVFGAVFEDDTSPEPSPEKAAAPSNPPAPPGAGAGECPWEEKFDEHSGLPYFVHKVTGESAWDKPGSSEDDAAPPVAVDDDDVIGSDEESVIDNVAPEGAWGDVIDSKPDADDDDDGGMASMMASMMTRELASDEESAVGNVARASAVADSKPDLDDDDDDAAENRLLAGFRDANDTVG